MTDQFERFKKVLRELFMIDDAADLDFGIYRIMHQKQKEIEKYLDVDLRRQVTDEVANNSGRERQQLQQEIDQLSRNAQGMGMNPDDVPAIREKKQQLAALGSSSDLEAEVYNHLATFFNRYYEGGDFVSRRRYKKDAYAIPYEGEEVKLYWANYDQYYIKTSEYLHNYSFRLSDGKQVVFRVVEATQEQNNNKPGNNWVRCFALADGEGQTPLEVDGNQMTINFTYELMPKANKLDEALIKQAYEKVAPVIKEQHAAFFHVFDLAPTDKDRNRTLLQKHLNAFKARNTFDYFIHKDLRGFLSRELDFYIKNEVLFIDDIDSRNASDFLQYLAVVKAVKAVGKTVITFLSGLEDFQKKLWLKKKFVVESNYCITLDRVPEKFYEEIAANDAQREEWVRLFAINDIKGDGMFTEAYSEPLTIEFLKQNPFLVLDTKFFAIEFKHKLTASIDDFDGQCDGLLVNSENFQVLQLLQEKYKDAVNAIYIDPPYNTDASAILYKNDYKDSSFLSMMYDKLCSARGLIEKDGLIAVAIDDAEVSKLMMLLDSVFIKNAGNVVVRSNPQSRKTKGKFSPQHEYCLFYGKDENAMPRSIGITADKLKRYPLKDENGNFSWMTFIRAGNNDKREDRPKLYYPIAVNTNDEIRILDMEWNPLTGEYDLLEQPSADEILVYPNRLVDGRIIEKNWQRGHERVKKEIPLNEYRVRRTNDGIAIDFKTRMDDEAMPTTWWDKAEYASANYAPIELKSLFGDNPFDFAKAV